MKVKCKRLTRGAGPKGNWSPGDEIYLDKDEAVELVAAHLVEIIQEMPEVKEIKTTPEKPEKAEIETATVEAPENAMMDPPTRRRKKK